MDSNLVLYLLFSFAATASAEELGTCNACNCQFRNVEVLDQLIGAKLATTQTNESGKLNYIFVTC